MIALVWLEILPLQSWAQESQTEEKPLCPERPFYHPTDREVAQTGLSPEVLCIIGDTWLMRHDPPGPEESPELLRRFLRLGSYGKMSGVEYRVVMEEAVRLWPKSYYAHAGLARALLGGHTAPDVQPTPTELRRAADEFLIAAEIAFSKGGIPPDHIENGLVQSLTELGDKQALDNYFKRVFELLTKSRNPEGYVRDEKYFSYLDYALVLAKLGDERAETYFQKAIAVRPELGSAYESYLGYLLDHGKAQAVLDFLDIQSKGRSFLSEDPFDFMRCQALKQLGRERECGPAGGPAPPGTPAPAGLGSGPSASVAPSMVERLP